MIIQETERLLLRHFHIFDDAAMEQIFCDEEVMRFGSGAKPKEFVRNWIRVTLQNYVQWGFGPWAVVEKAGRETMGYCGLFYFPDINGKPEVEIGYRLARRFWNSGYSTEAAIAVRDYGFTTLGLARIIAMVDPGNVASVRVAEKAGMHHESDVMMEGYTRPDRVYVSYLRTFQNASEVR